MADPVVIPIPADDWTKVATAVTIGKIEITKSGPDKYLQTTVDTGGAAPSGLSKAMRFDPSGVGLIGNDVPIDVYIYAIGAAGEVIADL